jgi:rare lipoprotein A
VAAGAGGADRLHQRTAAAGRRRSAGVCPGIFGAVGKQGGAATAACRFRARRLLPGRRTRRQYSCRSERYSRCRPARGAFRQRPEQAVYGKSYKPITDNTTPYKERGVGSWYGKKFHGQKTASGEIYDMYKMTAAHPTLPIPSYARVTNLKNGVQVIVRINDRGPFHSNRIIDLSYTAALKLGYLGSGSSQLEVERILPDEIERIAAAKKAGLPTSVASAVEAPVTTGSVAAAAMPEMAALSAPSMQPTASALDDNNPTIMPAPASAAQASPNPAATAAPPAGAYYLQFGAYAQEGNAQSARTTLTHSLAAVSDIAASLNAVPVNGMYRVYAGPYASRTAAQEAAQQVRAHSNAAPFVVESK